MLLGAGFRRESGCAATGHLVVALLLVTVTACTGQAQPDGEFARDEVAARSPYGVEHKQDSHPSSSRRAPCREGGEGGRGVTVSAYYPPRPYFEVFNLRRERIRGGCLYLVAGRKRTHDSDGEDDPNRYQANGGLLVFGDERTPDGIDFFRVPLVGPVRIVATRGNGYGTRLTPQSLEDCSIVDFIVGSKAFTQVPGGIETERRFSCPGPHDYDNLSEH